MLKTVNRNKASSNWSILIPSRNQKYQPSKKLLQYTSCDTYQRPSIINEVPHAHAIARVQHFIYEVYIPNMHTLECTRGINSTYKHVHELISAESALSIV